MSFIPFGTTANQQFDVSTTAIVLSEQIAADGNIDDIRGCDVIAVRVNNGQPIRYLVDGGIPTATHGNLTSSGFVVSGASINKIKLIRDTNSTASAEVCVSVGNNAANLVQTITL